MIKYIIINNVPWLWEIKLLNIFCNKLTIASHFLSEYNIISLSIVKIEFIFLVNRTLSCTNFETSFL